MAIQKAQWATVSPTCPGTESDLDLRLHWLWPARPEFFAERAREPPLVLLF